IYANIPESQWAHDAALHRVLIVGGGAGGLELATRLGDTLGKQMRASIALLDKSRVHVWKPHLHEVASGTLDVNVDSVEYLPHARYEPLRPGQLHCAIVGAGATGVELAAELHKTMRDLASYGLDRIDFDKLIKLTIIEAGPRILGPLPEPLAKATQDMLDRLGI